MRQSLGSVLRAALLVADLPVAWAAAPRMVALAAAAASTPAWLAVLAEVAAAVAARSTSPTFVTSLLALCPPAGNLRCINQAQQLPFNVGWQDLKDLFRQAGKQKRSTLVLGCTLTPFLQLAPAV